MNNARINSRSFALLAILALGAGCSSTDSRDDGEENLGNAKLQLVQVPAQTQCVEIEVSNASRMVERFLDVAPGQTSVFNLQQLPTGAVTFNGFAYASACASVTSSTLSTWRTAPTPATLTPGTAANVTLIFRPNGAADVTGDFVDEGTPTTCATGETMCAGTCVNTTTNPQNCGGCGIQCSAGSNCQNGVCSNVCPGGTVMCNGTCTNVSSDPQNCGACGAVCGGATPQCTNGVCQPPPGPGSPFSALFFQGQLPGGQVCQNWNQFRNNIPPPFPPTISMVSIESSLPGSNHICTEPAAAQALCEALRVGNPISRPCNGQNWNVQQCPGGVTLSVGIPSCQCGSTAAVRPCISNPDWGGTNNLTCGAPTQTLTVRCQ